MAVVWAERAGEFMLGGPLALRLAKQAVNRRLALNLGARLAREQACYVQVIPMQDRLERRVAFRRKRKPRFKGQ